jgi:hypothetical protein
MASCFSLVTTGLQFDIIEFDNDHCDSFQSIQKLINSEQTFRHGKDGFISTSRSNHGQTDTSVT